MKQLKRVVIKLGTSTLTKKSPYLSRPNILECVRQVSLLHEQGIEVIIVTSGAVAAGLEVLNHPKVARELPAKQMFAAIGQVKLMQIWSELFGIYSVKAGQMLLTKHDFNNRSRYLNIRDTLISLLSHKVVPIINENDTVATEEIKVGDNDNLSALIANLTGADLLVLLTDQEGLFTADPKSSPDAKLIPQVDHIDQKVKDLAGGASAQGTGGMITKIEAAQVATQSGTPTVIASFVQPNILLRLAKGEAVGTLFTSKTTPKESRKRWFLSEKPQGSIVVDEGAVEQLKHKGASLLPVGIRGIDKNFERGAVVHIFDLKNHLVGVGMANYSGAEIDRVKGAKSSQIAEILGYSYGDEVVHRDYMVITKESANG